MRPTTPVTVITGFLGSGKTTLVNHFLEQRSGLRMGIVVNEFGELGIDGSLISPTEGMDIVELSNGCVCCASRGDLEAALNALASSGRQFDHILVESSGLADPGPVIEQLASPPLSDRLRLEQTVTVVDASNFDTNLEHAEAAYNQITHADVLVLNKVDLVNPEVIEKIQGGLALLNSSARMLPAVRARVDLVDLLDSPSSTGAVQQQKQLSEKGRHAVHPAGLTSISIPCDSAVDEVQLRAWLSSLPRAVVRAKGLLNVHGASGIRIIAAHSVSGSVALEDRTETNRGGERGMVVIGVDLDEAAISSSFLRCLWQPEAAGTGSRVT